MDGGKSVHDSARSKRGCVLSLKYKYKVIDGTLGKVRPHLSTRSKVENASSPSILD
jgi:hypothetical protein